MKSMILRPREVIQAVNTGQVLVVRALKVQPWPEGHRITTKEKKELLTNHSPFGSPGEQRWVKHRWCHYPSLPANPRNEQAWDEVTRCVRWPSGEQILDCEPELGCPWRRRSSVHMPRWASRITTTLASLEVKRVQGITTQQCKLTGAEDEEWIGFMEWYESVAPPGSSRTSLKEDYSYRQWDKRTRIKDHKWHFNPWCWFATYDAEVK